MLYPNANEANLQYPSVSAPPLEKFVYLFQKKWNTPCPYGFPHCTSLVNAPCPLSESSDAFRLFRPWVLVCCPLFLEPCVNLFSGRIDKPEHFDYNRNNPCDYPVWRSYAAAYGTVMISLTWSCAMPWSFVYVEFAGGLFQGMGRSKTALSCIGFSHFSNHPAGRCLKIEYAAVSKRS